MICHIVYKKPKEVSLAQAFAVLSKLKYRVASFVFSKN